EFGGAVVFEALDMGVVPVVANFGGPGDIVNTSVGYSVDLVNEDDMIIKLESIVRRLAEDRAHLEELRAQGMAYARTHLTWEGKARVVTDILLWATGRASKPNLPPPKPLVPSSAAAISK